MIADKTDLTQAAARDTEINARLRSAAERIKRQLGREPTAGTVVNVAQTEHSISFTETEFEACCSELLERIRTPVSRALRDSRIDVESLDAVVMVGGSTRMPVVRKLVARLLGRFPEVSIPPDEAIALGAATQAALVAKSQSLEEVLLTDVCPYTLGIGTNPSGEFSPNVEYVFAPIIERNTILPASREEYFTTMIDMQRKVQCIVYQGEHRFVKDNIKLGSLDVQFPAKKAGDCLLYTSPSPRD